MKQYRIRRGSVRVGHVRYKRGSRIITDLLLPSIFDGIDLHDETPPFIQEGQNFVITATRKEFLFDPVCSNGVNPISFILFSSPIPGITIVNNRLRVYLNSTSALPVFQ